MFKYEIEFQKHLKKFIENEGKEVLKLSVGLNVEQI